MTFTAIALTCGFGLLAAASAGAERPGGASRLGVYATLSSDRRDFGLSRTDGGPSLEAGLDYQHASGFFSGLSAATIEYPANTGSAGSRHVQLDGYAGYNWRNAAWSATGALSRYVYPGARLDDDYSEIGAGFGYRERLFVTLAYTDALLGRGPSLLDSEAALSVPLPRGVALGFTLGRVDSKAFAGGRYTHWNAGASKAFGPVTLDARYYDNDAAGYAYYGVARRRSWVFSLSYGFTAR